MKTLSDLANAISTSRVGSVTVSIAANGKALASATFHPSFQSEQRWANSITEALTLLFASNDDNEDLL